MGVSKNESHSFVWLFQLQDTEITELTENFKKSHHPELENGGFLLNKHSNCNGHARPNIPPQTQKQTADILVEEDEILPFEDGGISFIPMQTLTGKKQCARICYKLLTSKFREKESKILRWLSRKTRPTW